MHIIYNDPDYTIPEHTVVAIGKFDGDHLGHKRIFEEMRSIKQLHGLKMAVFTFVFPGNPQIESQPEKHALLESEGIDYLVEYPFSDDIRMISGQDFIIHILKNRMNMSWIVAGDDCSFGYNRSGNAKLLNSMSDKLDYRVTIINRIRLDDTEISSTNIRKLLSEGNVKMIHKLKGGYYSLSGQVILNKQLGRTIGFPTANIIPSSEKLLPKRGVYATRTLLENGQIYDSMTNIGYNPSVTEQDPSSVKCETHIFDFSEDIYGQNITVFFVDRIRDEQKFDSVENLVRQLGTDKNYVIHILNNQS